MKGVHMPAPRRRWVTYRIRGPFGGRATMRRIPRHGFCSALPRRVARSTIFLLALAVGQVAVAQRGACAVARSIVTHGSADPYSNVRRHVVGAGENLTAVALRYGVSVDAVAKHNRLADLDRIRVGQTLVIPEPTLDPELPARLRSLPLRMALRPVFARWARANRIPTDLLEAMAWLESGWNQAKISSTGAIGIGQLMPDTAAFVARELIGRPLDPRVPEDNIRMSARFLRYLLNKADGDVATALCGYYQGLRSMRHNGLYRATRQYAADVQALRTRFRPSS